MNPNLDRNIINDHITAVVAEIDLMSAGLAELRKATQRADTSAIAHYRDLCKERWAKLALKTRTLEEVRRRVALQAIRVAMLEDEEGLAELLFDKIPDAVGDEIFVDDNGEQLDFVVAAVWRGVAKALGLDAASLTPPRLQLRRCADGWRLRPRWFWLLSPEDATEARRRYEVIMLQGQRTF